MQIGSEKSDPTKINSPCLYKSRRKPPRFPRQSQFPCIFNDQYQTLYKQHHLRFPQRCPLPWHRHQKLIPWYPHEILLVHSRPPKHDPSGNRGRPIIWHSYRSRCIRLNQNSLWHVRPQRSRRHCQLTTFPQISTIRLCNHSLYPWLLETWRKTYHVHTVCCWFRSKIFFKYYAMHLINFLKDNY